MEYKYDIFLSYRHKPLDGIVTQKTFNMLESYKLPPYLKQQGYPDVKRVFRDTEELAVSRILSNTIEEALRATNCLVVVCSLDTPSSEWVDREVATFIEMGRAEKIFPLLISGDPDVSFPPSLKKVPDIMNRLMDVRCPGDEAKQILAKEELALLRVIANASGCHHTDLVRYHKLRKTADAVRKSVGAVGIFAAVGLVSASLMMAADAYRDTAKKEQAASMAVLESLTYDLPNKLAELPDTYGTIVEILEKNADQINEILNLAENKDVVTVEIGANYEKLATAFAALGNDERTMQYQNKAIDLYQSLYDKGIPEGALSLSSAWNNIGVALHATGQYEEAQEAYGKALNYGEEAKTALSSYESQYNLGIFANNAGSNSFDAGNYQAAMDYYEESNAVLEDLYGDGHEGTASMLSKNCQNTGNCLYQTGKYAEAEEWLERGMTLGNEVFEKARNRTNLSSLVQIQGMMASCLGLQAKFEEAKGYFEEAIAMQETLAQDTSNIKAQEDLAVLYNNYGLSFNMEGKYAKAEEWYLKSADRREYVDGASGTLLSRALLARACYNVAENAFKAQSYELCKEYYERCLSLYGPVSGALGAYHRSEYLSRLAYYQIIIDRNYQGALVNAAQALDLQPESSFPQYIFAYALMYNGLYDACDQVFAGLATRSEGEVVNVKLDFEALTAAGLSHEHMADVITLMEK